MRFRPILLVSVVLTFARMGLVQASEPSLAAATAARDQWMESHLSLPGISPVSFIYNGRKSAEILADWQAAPVATKSLSQGRTERTQRWIDPKTGLEVRIVSVSYADYPAVEWTGYLKNSGQQPTPLIESLQGIDGGFDSVGKETVLRTIKGDNFSASSYEPAQYRMDQLPRTFQPVGGRPTDTGWPYYNLDFGQHGVLLALGWPGQWKADFTRSHDSLMVRGGQETTHLHLNPGEEIRTPLVALLFWQGSDWIAGQNQWRHWFIADNLPRCDGQLPPTDNMICLPGLHSSAEQEISGLNTYLENGVKFDYLWIDAGWYKMDRDWFSAQGIGTWKPDTQRYPHGIRQVSDYVHGKGMKLVLWFEPERVYRGSDLWNEHPDWLLKWAEGAKGKNDLRLLNLGNPAARQWITDYISRFITEQGIDIYRQDFNVEPEGAWRTNDTPDRQGLTENLYVQGYLAYWDGLLKAHPGMLIDSCASGGRRNDLETMRRGVPLLRSDYQAPGLGDGAGSMTTDVFDGNQGHTYGLSLWLPFFGTGEYAEDVYSARSHLCPWMGIGIHLEDPDWAAVRRQVFDHRQVAPFFYGDYYPLTDYTKSESDWIAWQFVRTEQGDGMVQAFRRENSPRVESFLKLKGLKSEASYEFTNIDNGKKRAFTGKTLMETGLPAQAAAPRTALIYTFKETKS